MVFFTWSIAHMLVAPMAAKRYFDANCGLFPTNTPWGKKKGTNFLLCASF